MKMVYYVMVANIKHYDGREPISDSREYFYYGMGMATDHRPADRTHWVPDLFKVPYLKDGVRDYRFSGRWVGNYADRDLLLVKMWFLGRNRVG